VTTPCQIVWFKRDLRVDDHEPLALACERGPVLPLYIFEPDLWRQPDASGRQFAFLRDALTELRAQLARIGQPLVIRVGDAVSCLETLHQDIAVTDLWSHEETGNGWTYLRDRAVAAWCGRHGITWHERPQFGVIRRLRDRRGWARRWDRFMTKPAWSAPKGLMPLTAIDAGPLPDAHDIGLTPDPCPGRFSGGRRAGFNELQSFLHDRGEPYQKAMSSPLTAPASCSRLSPHLAYGTVSMRETFQAARHRQDALRAQPKPRQGRWPGAIRSFLARLHWHCHFIQKLEDEPEIEFRCFHPAYEGLRTDNAERLERWTTGQTGFPFVDACMRALDADGWINFRMRAMLVSFASYQLWLPWRSTGAPLARLFTDYEPGIHWSQMQMQSAATGINLPRIYNPIKQGRDFDAEGHFIRRWVPELEGVPTIFVHEPWQWPNADRDLRGTYPPPLVDERSSRQQAQQAIWAIRRQPDYRAIADAIQMRHGSRKSGMSQQKQQASSTMGRSKPSAPTQLSLLSGD